MRDLDRAVCLIGYAATIRDQFEQACAAVHLEAEWHLHCTKDGRGLAAVLLLDAHVNLRADDKLSERGHDLFAYISDSAATRVDRLFDKRDRDVAFVVHLIAAVELRLD